MHDLVSLFLFSRMAVATWRQLSNWKESKESPHHRHLTRNQLEHLERKQRESCRGSEFKHGQSEHRSALIVERLSLRRNFSANLTAVTGNLANSVQGIDLSGASSKLTKGFSELQQSVKESVGRTEEDAVTELPEGGSSEAQAIKAGGWM
jgi:hypothetical protein